MTTIKPKWMCDNCGEIHEEEDRAVNCCKPHVTKVFLCPVCGDDYLTDTEAGSCCDADPPAPYSIPKVAEDTAAYIAEFCQINNLKG